MSKVTLPCFFAFLMLFSACSQKVEIDYDLLADKITKGLQNTHPEQPTELEGAIELERVITNPFNGHRYVLINKQMTWREAKKYAERLGGYLATITSFEEQDWICQTFPRVQCWLGGTDEEVEGEWKWITGEKWDYTNWNFPGEPSNNYRPAGGGEENALCFSPSYGKWNDLPADTLTSSIVGGTSFLVEFNPQTDPK